MKEKSAIQMIKEKEPRDRSIRKKLEVKKDKVKLVKEWGSWWIGYEE